MEAKTLLLPGVQQGPLRWEPHAGNENLDLLILEDLSSCLGSADYLCDSAFSLTTHPGRVPVTHTPLHKKVRASEAIPNSPTALGFPTWAQ